MTGCGDQALTDHPSAHQLTQFWIDDGLRNIQPPGENPAGFDEVAHLRDVHRRCHARDVVELGCGYGRLAPAFEPDHYLGLDINPDAVARARRSAPDHRFALIEFDEPLPPGDLGLAYTVLLHIDDRNIVDVAARMSRAFRKILIVEIMDRRVRDWANSVPAFSRDRREYESLFDRYELGFEIRRPYERYASQGLELSYVLLER